MVSIKNAKGENVEAKLNQNKFLLIDWNNLIYKYFYTMPETLDEKGNDINAIIGFMKGLKNAFYNTQPIFFAIAFDSRENKRKDIDSEYKAQRKETPESLKRQIEELINLLQEWWFPVFIYPGFEGDDIICSLANRNRLNKNIKVIICSSDKDFKQMLDDNIVIYNHQKVKYGDIKVLYTVEDFIKEYNFYPCHFVDYLSIIGDTADNIKWLPNVWEVGAKKIIQEYKSIDNIYENIDNIKWALKKKLIEGKEELMKSKELVQFMDVSIPQLNKNIVITDKHYQMINDYIRRYWTNQAN